MLDIVDLLRDEIIEEVNNTLYDNFIITTEKEKLSMVIDEKVQPNYNDRTHIYGNITEELWRKYYEKLY